MCRPVFLPACRASVVMCYHAAPHDICPCSIVLRGPHDTSCRVNDGKYGSLSESVTYHNVVCIGEVSLQDVRYHICNSRRCLPCGQCECQLGVHYREFRSEQHRLLHAEFLLCRLTCYDSIARALRPCCGYCQHCSHRQGCHWLCLPDIEIPEITVVWHTGTYRLCCVNDRATTDSKHEVDVILTGYLDALIYFWVGRVWSYTSQQDNLKPF